MKNITLWSLRHKRIVLTFWIVLTLVGVGSAGAASKALSDQYSNPGHESYTANQRIAREFGNGGTGAPLVAVVTLPRDVSINSPTALSGLQTITGLMEQTVPHMRVASYVTTNHDPAFVSRNGRTTFVIAYPPPEASAYGTSPMAAKELSNALKGITIGGAPVYVTGNDALAASTGESKGPSVLVEGLIGGLGALIVLAFVFASFLALLPLLIALVSIMTSFLVLWGLASLISVSYVVEFLIALVGLGIAIDYSLLIVARWREERAQGHVGEEAIVRAMETAGHAVLFSGTAVAIGLLALVAIPVPFIRSIGLGGMLIPVITVAVTITLLPVVLAKVGHKLDWPHVRTDRHVSRAWEGWGRLVVRFRWVALLTAIVILGFLVGSATKLTLGPLNGDPATLSQQGEAKTGLMVLQQSGIGSGVLSPIEVLAPANDALGIVHKLYVSKAPDFQGATAPIDSNWQHGSTQIVDVFTHNNTAGALSAVRRVVHSSGSGALVGGIDAENRDFIYGMYHYFPLVIVLLSIFTFILLARAFRSILLPIKAVLLNVISLFAAWGAVTLIWQMGYGSHALWGIPATGPLPSWIPFIIFAVLFGISMDYEVFIVSRMREAYDQSGSTDKAVVVGIGRTGRLVTSAGLIMFLAFLSMSTTPSTPVKIMATGLGAGLILDATVMRALLVPAAVSLFGRWNWKIPHSWERVLRVAPLGKDSE